MAVKTEKTDMTSSAPIVSTSTVEGPLMRLPLELLPQIGRRLDPISNAKLMMTCTHFLSGRTSIEAQLRMDKREEIHKIFTFVEKHFAPPPDIYKTNIDSLIDQLTLQNTELVDVQIKIQLLELLKFLNVECLKLALEGNQEGIDPLQFEMKKLYLLEIHRKIKGSFQFAKYQKYIDLAQQLIHQQKFDLAIEIALILPIPLARNELLARVACSYADLRNFKKVDEVLIQMDERYSIEKATEYLCAVLAVDGFYDKIQQRAQTVASQDVRARIIANSFFAQNRIKEGVEIINKIKNALKREYVNLWACMTLSRMKFLPEALLVFSALTVPACQKAALEHLQAAFPES